MAFILAGVATLRACDRSTQQLRQSAPLVLDSVKLREERMDAWAPILWNADTIGKLVSVARIGPVLLYHGVLTGRPPAYQPDSLAAIDSTDDARFAHELRLIPRHALGGRTRSLGSLRLEPATEDIPVMAAP